MSKKPQNRPAEGRDNAGRFAKGVSGNPGGESSGDKKKRLDLARMVRRLDAERSKGGMSAIVENLFDLFFAAVAEGDAKAALGIGKELLDRGHGKARQDINIDTDGGALKVVYAIPDNGRKG